MQSWFACYQGDNFTREQVGALRYVSGSGRNESHLAQTIQSSPEHFRGFGLGAQALLEIHYLDRGQAEQGGEGWDLPIEK